MILLSIYTKMYHRSIMFPLQSIIVLKFLPLLFITHAGQKSNIIRLDMSAAGANPASIRSYLDGTFYVYEKEYEVEVRPESSLAIRFNNIIETACKKTGQQVAVLIDEYDSPLQHSWKPPQHEACTAIYKEVFAILKKQDKYEKFVFITGITKFTQISLFSVLNNLSNLSFEPGYAAICGITKDECPTRRAHNAHRFGQ